MYGQTPAKHHRAGFRMLKSSLGLRPNHHQLEDRVDGHIFISVLAYHLLNWVRQKLEHSGDHREWNTIRLHARPQRGGHVALV